MRVNSIEKTPLKFKGGLNNKILLSGLEKISDHGASFAAGVSFLSAMFVRPFAISLTPKTEKENKKYASANSLASGVSKLLITEAIAIPLENAINKIDKNPGKYLNESTIRTLKGSAKSLAVSSDYKFLTQSTKLSAGLISAVPKALITATLIPIAADKIFSNKKKSSVNSVNNISYNTVFSPVYNSIPFKGGEKIAQGVGKIFDSKWAQNLAHKFSKNEANIARNISMGTDALLCATTALGIKKSRQIDEKRKNPLIYNNVISTASCILFGYGLDKAVKKGTASLTDKFISANRGNPKLSKYIQGINILRPTMIFALVYYGILPVVSTFLADKLDKKIASGSPKTT